MILSGLTQGVASILTSIILAVSCASGIDAFSFYRDVMTSKQFEVIGTSEVTFNSDVYSKRVTDAYKDATGEVMNAMPFESADFEKASITYNVKGDFKDEANPRLDLGIGYTIDKKIEGNVRLLFADGVLYTDVETARSVLQLLFYIEGVEAETRSAVVNDFENSVTDNKIKYYKVVDISGSEYEDILTEVAEAGNEQIIAEKSIELFTTLLKGYKSDVLKAMEDGYEINMTAEQIVPELENLHKTYTKNRDNRASKAMYELAKLIHDGYMASDYAEGNGPQFMSYDEFLVELKDAEGEVANALKNLKTNKAHPIYEAITNAKGSKVSYKLAHKDGVYKVNSTYQDFYKGKQVFNIVSEGVYSPKTEPIEAPKDGIYDLLQQFEEIVQAVEQ